MQKVENKAGDIVLLDLLFHTPAEQVWKAWTKPDLVLLWFGSDPDGKGVEANLDVVPGGRFEITFMNSDGTRHTCHGVYLEVEKPHKLSFTWTWESEPGVESFVTVLLAAIPGGTRMQFTHERFGWDSSHQYKKGWESTFEKLGRMLQT